MNQFKRIICTVLALVLLVGSVPMTASAAGDVMYGLGFVNATSLRLRQEASTGSKIVDTAYNKEVVVVVSKEGDWYKVIYNLLEGYMHEDYLKISKEADAELGYGRFNATSVNVRKGPGTSYSSLGRGNKGDKVYIIGIYDGWYKIIFGEKLGYVRSDYLTLTEIPYENKDSDNEPKFFRGGKSTGTEPSAEALKGNVSTKPETEQKPEKEESKEETTKPETSAPAESDLMQAIAYVNGSGLRLRQEANTRSRILDSANRNEVVVVIAKEGDWYKVNYDLKVGYMSADYLKVHTSGDAELGYGKFVADGINVRQGPGTSHDQISTGNKGEKAYIIGIRDGWYRVIFDGKIGFVRSDFLQLTETPRENKSNPKSPLFFRGGKSTGTEPSAEALNGGTGTDNSGTVTGQQIVNKAIQYLGVPYKWGGTSPSGFDCSGFVYYVMRSQGIQISRTQAAMYKQGTQVDKDELQPGDLVFFQNTYKSGISHVGIYVGDGKFIHAPSSGKVVSYADLYSDYYIAHYYGAARYTD